MACRTVRKSSCIKQSDTNVGDYQPINGKSHLTEGGEPDGIRILAGESGNRINSISMRRITVTGNSNTIPNGTDIDEFPFNRIRRRRKANRCDSQVFEKSSIEDIFVLEGKRW